MKNRKLLLAFGLCFYAAQLLAQTGGSVYASAITASGTGNYPLSKCKGKKIWIVVLPATQTLADIAFFRRIDSVTKANSGKLTTLVFPSLEDGYTGDSTSVLFKLYKTSLDSNIVLSQPAYTHKSSAAKQHGLFQWLTNVGQNTHFDYDVEGVESSFFVDEQGTLYAVFNGLATLSNKALKMALP